MSMLRFVKICFKEGIGAKRQESSKENGGSRKIEDDDMKTEHETIVADRRGFRLAHVTVVANTLADDQLEICIRPLQNIVSTVPKDSKEWGEMNIVLNKSTKTQMKLNAESLNNIPSDVLRFENPYEKARMFYD